MYRARSREDGAAAVEFALVMPIFFLIVFGIVDFGRAYFTTSSLSHASREGVRVVALNKTAADAKARAIEAAAGLDPDDVTVTVQDSAGDPVADGWTCQFSDPVTVVVTSTFEYVTPLGGFVNMINPTVEEFDGPSSLTSRASMRCGG